MGTISQAGLSVGFGWTLALMVGSGKKTLSGTTYFVPKPGAVQGSLVVCDIHQGAVAVVGHGSHTGEGPHSCPLGLALSWVELEHLPAHLWVRRTVKA